MNEMLPTPEETLDEIGNAACQLDEALALLDQVSRAEAADLFGLATFDKATKSMAASRETLNELYSRLEQGIADGKEY